MTESYFCGWCENEADCLEITGIANKEDCEGVDACFLPNGEIEFLSQEECNQRGACSDFCSDTNSSICLSRFAGDSSLCVDATAPTESECLGTWRSDLKYTSIEDSGACVYPHLNQQQCTLRGFDYQSCNGLSMDECQACSEGGCPSAINQLLLQCYVKPYWRHCSTIDECTDHGGKCDDEDFYTFFNGDGENGTNVAPVFGACIYPPDTFPLTAPYCYDAPDQSPSGCYFSDYDSLVPESDCQESGGSWHELARTKEECITDKGCLPDPSVRVLLPMEKKICLECGSTVESYYRWKAGVWVASKHSKLQWKKRQTVPIFTWKSTLNFTAIMNDIQSAAESTIISDIQSQILCTVNSKSKVLQSVACACALIDEISTCFPSEKYIEAGVARPCIGLETKIESAVLMFATDNNTVQIDSKDRCVEVLLFTASINSKRIPDQVLFSPLTRAREYNVFDIVLNGDGAIVGRVMSDGVLIRLESQIQNYQLCIQLNPTAGEASSKFSVWDFGVVDGDFLKALMLDVNPMKSTSKAENTDFYCTTILNPALKEEYYLIRRLENPDDASGSLYSSGELATWYVFASAFVVLTIMMIGLIVGHFTGFPLHPYFVYMTITFVMMCVIRSIYFFLLATRVLQDDHSGIAYFLIEFPTLLYFTSFSSLVAFWLFLLYSEGRKLTKIGFFSFNTFLYLLFVILIILFKTLPQDVTDSVCESRIPPEEDNTKQYIVSVFYQSFMAGVAILLAVGIVSFGLKLYLGMMKTNAFEKKVVSVTVCCAVGLLLHCAFILYLSITFDANFTIIVLMITLSEIIPIGFIAFQFSFLRGQCFGKKISVSAYGDKIGSLINNSATSKTSKSSAAGSL